MIESVNEWFFCFICEPKYMLITDLLNVYHWFINCHNQVQWNILPNNESLFPLVHRTHSPGALGYNAHGEVIIVILVYSYIAFEQLFRARFIKLN